MAFDQRDPGSIQLIYPSAYHPRAPCVPTAPAEALRIAYAFARHHGQMCWQVHYASSLTRPDAERNMGNWIPQGANPHDYSTFGAGWHWLPPQATHVTGYCLFQLKDTSIANDFRARIVLTDGTNTDTGPTQDYFGNAADPSVAYDTSSGAVVQGGLGPFDDANPGNARLRVQVQRVNVPTSDVSGLRVRSYIECFSVAQTNGSTTFETAVIPHYAAAFWEVFG